MIEEQAAQDQQPDLNAIRAEMTEQVFGIPAGDEVEHQLANEETQSETQTQEQEADPWAGVSPALREQFNALTNKVSVYDQMAERLKQAERRVGSLQNEFHAAKTAAAKVASAPTPEEMATAAKSSKAWDDLKESFPDWAEAIEGKLAAQSAEVSKKLTDIETFRSEIAGATGQTRAELVADFERRLEFAKLEMRHPDYAEVKETPQFISFLTTLPESLKIELNDFTARSASKVLDLFKATLKPTKTAREINESRQQRLNQAQTVNGKTLRPTKSEADMSPEELRAHWAAQVWKK